MTEPERGSFPQVERGQGPVPKDSQVKEMRRQGDSQRRQPFTGDRVKFTTPFEDKPSWVTRPPRVFSVVLQSMPANGDDPRGSDKIGMASCRNDDAKML